MKQQLKQQASNHELHKFKEGQAMADLQYQIWATFMKSTGEHLRNRELRLMAESSKLLDSLSNSKVFNREQESTIDSNSSLRQLHFDRETINRFNSPENKILARKSPRANNKGFNIAYSDQLKDIQENCNPSTVQWIRSLVSEHKKLKQSLSEVQSNEKRLQRNLQNFQKQEEHLLILKRVHQETEKKLQRCQNQISQLKTKNKALHSQINTMMNKKQQGVTMDTKALGNLTSFLNEKQRNINTKMNNIVAIEENILEIVRSTITEAGCDNCCIFLRKIKDVMGKMRRSLLDESEQIQNIYNRYKAIFCGGSY